MPSTRISTMFADVIETTLATHAIDLDVTWETGITTVPTQGPGGPQDVQMAPAFFVVMGIPSPVLGESISTLIIGQNPTKVDADSLRDVIRQLIEKLREAHAEKLRVSAADTPGGALIQG